MICCVSPFPSTYIPEQLSCGAKTTTRVTEGAGRERLFFLLGLLSRVSRLAALAKKKKKERETALSLINAPTAN